MTRKIRENEQDKAFAGSLHYLKYRPRTRYEIETYLKKKGFSDTAVSGAIKRLEDYRFIDDAEFARMWVENRSRNRPRGAFALRRELAQKGVPEALAEKALSDFHETEPAWRVVLPKLKRWEKLESIELKRKIYDHLRRRGFAYDTCEEVLKKALHLLGKEPTDSFA